MKKKIVLKVQMNCDKCRTKALEVASSADGIISLAITGADKNQLVVVGDGVDTSELVSSLRKKVGHTTIETIEDVKEPEKKKEENTCTITYPCPCPPPYCPPPYCPPPYPHSNLLYCYDEPIPTNNCSIM